MRTVDQTLGHCAAGKVSLGSLPNPGLLLCLHPPQTPMSSANLLSKARFGHSLVKPKRAFRDLDDSSGLSGLSTMSGALQHLLYGDDLG